MSSLQVQAELIVAAFDLAAVQLIIGAIRNADQASAAAVAGDLAALEPEFGRRRHIEPRDFYEPRRHVHPTPVYDARQVIHQRRRVELQELACSDRVPTLPPMNLENPIQPPWKVLEWPSAVPPRQTVKIHLIRADVVNKGVQLDLFV